MTDTEKLEAIKAELERRYNYHRDHADDWAGTSHFWREHEDKEILSFIDSMQKEPAKQPVDEAMAEIEEKAKAFTESHKGESAEDILRQMQGKETASGDLHSAAKEYANGITEKIGYRIQLRRAVIYGAKWKEKQLTKDAVSGQVCGKAQDHINVKVDNGQFLTPPNVMHIIADKSKYKVGDNVKVIVIK